ncbi:MAG: hypothetical protein DRP90_06515, partial [Planctomycetota bacterium]
MDKTLHLRLLGNIEIALGDEPVTGFVSAKAQALLCYLAVTGRPHPRPALAGLLWGEKPEEAALVNLRQAVSNLRRLVGEHLLTTRQTVAFNRDSPHRLDVEEFEQLLSGKHTPFRNLRRAVELYRGDFLSGLYVRGAPGFEEWVLINRARFQTLAAEALHHLIARHTRRGEYRPAIRYAERLLEMNPWREDIHRQLMWLLAHTGQREAALTRYEQCRRTLAAGLGVKPTAETTSLYERIRASRGTPPLPLPPQPTPFVGRKGELRGIIRRLANHDCRLLTLWGPGGVGKTRLALEVAARLRNAFLHGVYFIPLATVSPPASLRLPYAIAEALHIPLQGTGEPTARLFDFLREKESLLVLDNFEHLLDGVPLLAKLLETAPEVKLLVTSREQLRSRWEWLFEVRGLPVPDETTRQPGRFDGVRLFIRQARRVRPGFAPEKEMAAVTHICRTVEGLPLGIELAAALLGEHTADEIATGIDRALAFLHSPMQDTPARHRSLQAAFDYSWRLLSPDEQTAFRRLSVFRGGFEEEAAQEITAATPARLKALKAKSLLRRGPDGRYEMLEVLRQYAEERLLEAKEEWEETRARHGEYYATMLRRLWSDVRQGKRAFPLAAIERELENIQAAYRRAVERDDWQALGAMLPVLSDFYKRRSRFREGAQAATEAVAVLRRAVERGEDGARATLCICLTRRGIMLYALGQHNEARATFEESLRLAEETGDKWEQALVLNNLAILFNEEDGNYRVACRLFEKSLGLFSAVGDRRMEAVLLNNLALTHRILGEHDKARRLTRESLRICRERGFKTEEARAVLSLGLVAHGQEEYEEAIRRYREGLALFRELGDRWGEAMTLGNLGVVLMEKKDYEEARRVLSESLTLRREVGNRLGIVIALNNLARAAREMGDEETAASHLSAALSLASEIPSVPMALDSLADVALLRAQRGDMARALELAYLVIHHPATDTVTQRSVAQFIARLERQVPPEVADQAQERAEGQEVLAVAEEMT